MRLTFGWPLLMVAFPSAPCPPIDMHLRRRKWSICDDCKVIQESLIAQLILLDVHLQICIDFSFVEHILLEASWNWKSHVSSLLETLCDASFLAHWVNSVLICFSAYRRQRPQSSSLKTQIQFGQKPPKVFCHQAREWNISFGGSLQIFMIEWEIHGWDLCCYL